MKKAVYKLLVTLLLTCKMKVQANNCFAEELPTFIQDSSEDRGNMRWLTMIISND